jgi:hypothetical protein
LKSQPPSFGKSLPESQSKSKVSHDESRLPVLNKQSFEVDNRASTKQGLPSFSKNSDQPTGFDKMGDANLSSVYKEIDFEAGNKRDGHPTASPLIQPIDSILAIPGSAVGVERQVPFKLGDQSPLDAKSSIEESVVMTESPLKFELPPTPENKSVSTNFKLVEDASGDIFSVLDEQEYKSLPGKNNISPGRDLECIPKVTDKSGSTCPKCESVLMPGVKICVACGPDRANDDGKTKPVDGSPITASQRPLPTRSAVEEKLSKEAFKPVPALSPVSAGLQAFKDDPEKVDGEPPVKVFSVNTVTKGVTTSLYSEEVSVRELRQPISRPLGSQLKSKSWETPATELVTEPLEAPTTAQLKQVEFGSLQKPIISKSKPKLKVALTVGIAVAGIVAVAVAAWLWGSRPPSSAELPFAAPASQVPIAAPEVSATTLPAPVNPPPADKPPEPAPSPIPAPVAPAVKPEPKLPPNPKLESKAIPEFDAKPSARPAPAKTAARKELSEREKQIMDQANKTLDDLLK